MNKRKICVYGIGGVGGYLGGMLANASSDKLEVYFIARGKHLMAIDKNGLTLATPSKGEIKCHPTKVVDNVDDLPIMDYVFLTVKGYDLMDAVKDINKISNENTVIIAPLNGVDIYERIKEWLDKGIVLPSCIFVTSSVNGPGKVVHKGGTTLLVFGKDPQFESYYPSELLEILNESEIPYRWERRPETTIWEKFIMFSPFALVTAYSGKSFGEVMEDQEHKGLIRSIMEEVVDLAKAKGIPVKDSLIETYLGNAQFYPYETRTSYQRDIESGRGKDEGDLIGGTIIRLGKEYGVPTSVAEIVYGKIRSKIL
ncbi:ketopantoate reductase family protein [Gudongella sp. SC589]|uniref:ketopantoate reductase family protein n=1 Tax=Gudongella sp. SC589 TaxID=3385990 RepID=UPI0039047C1B